MAIMNKVFRDKLSRVIVYNDYVLWTNGKYNMGWVIAKVVGSVNNRVQILRIDNNKSTYVRPENLVVITQQLQANVEDRVGVNMDLEAMREARKGS